MSSLVNVAADIIGRDIDLGTVTVSDAVIADYAAAVGDRALATDPPAALPLGLALALRGGPTPAVVAAAGTISVHGGHTIVRRGRFVAGEQYYARSRIVGIFEKSGRSGPLAVVARHAALSDRAGAVAVAIDEQEIVRWRTPPRGDIGPVLVEPRAAGATIADPMPALDLDRLEVGDVIAEPWSAPSEAAVAAYSRSIPPDGGSLFTDPRLARSLGYRNVIVPGPVQSAAIEAMLRRRFQAAVIVSLGMTFRISISPGDKLMLTAVVVEQRPAQDGAAVVCDLAVEHSGDRVATGTAELRPG